MRIIRIGLLTVAFSASIWGFTVPHYVNAQYHEIPDVRINTQQITELERRVDNLEGQRLDARISAMQVTAEDNNHMLLAVLASVLILVVNAVVQIVSSRMKD